MGTRKYKCKKAGKNMSSEIVGILSKALQLFTGTIKNIDIFSDFL